MTLRLEGLSGKVQRREVASLRSNNSGAADFSFSACSANITTPVAAPETIPAGQVYCSTGAIVINNTVTINGAWRLT